MSLRHIKDHKNKARKRKMKERGGKKRKRRKKKKKWWMIMVMGVTAMHPRVTKTLNLPFKCFYLNAVTHLKHL